jgi:type II secretory pathway pseudopilin PulG
MKRLLLWGSLSLTLVLTACPNSTQQAQIAQAALTASTVASAAQQAEITAYQQGKQCPPSSSTCLTISDADHHFIQEQFATLGTVGKTLDGCIRSSGTPAGAVACISTATSAVDQINQQGGLYIKSPQAKQDFQAAMAALKVALVAISQVIGGK